MLKYWMSLLALVTSLAAAPAHAADNIHLDIKKLKLDAPCAPEVTGVRRVSLEHNGAPGYWFHQAVGRCMLTRLSMVPILAERVELLQSRAKLSDNVLSIREDLVKYANASRKIAVDNFTTMAKLKREAEEDRDSLFAGKPVVWVVVGVGAAIVLEVVAVLVISSVTK